MPPNRPTTDRLTTPAAKPPTPTARTLATPAPPMLVAVARERGKTAREREESAVDAVGIQTGLIGTERFAAYRERHLAEFDAQVA